MKRTEEIALGGGNYETPAASVVELNPEGVLCMSGQTEEWEEDTLIW